MAKKLYSIPARKRIIKMIKFFKDGKEGTLVIKGSGQRKFMKFKKSKEEQVKKDKNK